MNLNRILAEHASIKTERLLLRPFQITDAAAMYTYMSDPENMRFTPPVKQSEEEVVEVLVNYFIKEPLGKYAIIWQETGQLVGDVSLRIHEKFRRTEIGYTVRRSFWGKGIMPEVLEALLILCFDELALKRVDAGCEVENQQSARVLEKIGMQREGILRNYLYFEERSRDMILFSMTDTEWQIRKKAEEPQK